MGLSNVEDLLETGVEQPVKPMSRLEAILRGEQVTPMSRIESLMIGYNPGGGGGDSVLSSASMDEISAKVTFKSSSRTYPDIPILYEEVSE